jgi:hypothetical protein
MENFIQNNCKKSINNNNNLFDSNIIKYSGFFSDDNIFKKNKKKLHLPSISNKISRNQLFSNNNDNNIQISNFNSYFIPENFQEYSKCFNKYEHKLDPLIKEKLSLKNNILNNRKYNKIEKILYSNFRKDEMKHRASGQGIFFLFEKYNKNNKRKPIQLKIKINSNNKEKYLKKIDSKRNILNNNNYNQNNNYSSSKKHNKNIITEINKKNKINQNQSSFIKKNNNKSEDLKIVQLINRLRDQRIISALKNSGDENLIFNIGV